MAEWISDLEWAARGLIILSVQQLLTFTPALPPTKTTLSILLKHPLKSLSSRHWQTSSPTTKKLRHYPTTEVEDLIPALAKANGLSIEDVRRSYAKEFGEICCYFPERFNEWINVLNEEEPPQRFIDTRFLRDLENRVPREIWDDEKALAQRSAT